MLPLVDTEDPAFKARRAQNWVFLGLMYAMFYMGRYNFSAVNALLADHFGWTNTDLGNVIAAGKICYGASVFLNGPLADRIGGKRAILIGASGAALFNLLFGLFGSWVLMGDATWSADHKTVVAPALLNGGMTVGTTVATFSVLWALNHYFQSFGALSIVKINASWFKITERGSFAGIFGIMIQSGRTLAFAVGPLIVGAMPWQWVFFVPAILLLILIVLNIKLVENSPADAGLGELTTGDEVEGEEKGGLAFVLKKVFGHRQMWIIALSSMMIGFVRNGTDDWFPKFFANVHHAQPIARGPTLTMVNIGALISSVFVIIGILQLKKRVDRRSDWTALKRFGVTFSTVGVFFAVIGAGIIYSLDGMEEIKRATICLTFASVAMPIASVFGGIVSGNASDALFGHRRAPVICVAFLGMALVQIVFFLVGGGPLFAAWMMVGLAFFIQSAHSMVGGAASMDFGGKKAVATAAGLFDGAQYVAGAIVAQTLGRLIDAYGWGAWGITQVPFALMGALLIATLWNVRPGRGGH